MNGDRRQVASIVLSMVTTCVAGAAVLGGVYVATARHSEAQKLAAERREVTELLALDASASVLEVRQFFSPARREIVYRIAAMAGGETPRELTFDLDGHPIASIDRVPHSAEGSGSGAVAAEASRDELRPLGRVFVAYHGSAPAGFVIEGIANGYKNRIRFLVGLGPDFDIAGVRVVEHEEDPGLGAEVAATEFEGQFIGRQTAALEVTRDPMPKDWRAALLELKRMAPDAWRARHGALLDRERRRPVYAVTGATISSRALTEGVAVTIERFRSRWERIAPYLQEATPGAGNPRATGSTDRAIVRVEPAGEASR